jgi:hypothetical protein
VDGRRFFCRKRAQGTQRFLTADERGFFFLSASTGERIKGEVPSSTLICFLPPPNFQRTLAAFGKTKRPENQFNQNHFA